jgi:hypothetical protein
MTMPTPINPGYSIYIRRIPEIVVPGKRLGRHYRYDSRFARYPFRPDSEGMTLADQLWTRHIPILDQGDVGSCTGNEEVGVLGTDPFYSALSPIQQKSLNESLALKIYSDAETLDGDGPYPPNDNGSSGSSVAQVALNDKLISGYTHITDVHDMAAALQVGPLGVGVNWWSSFDTPDSSGLVAIAPGAYVRGGHEFEVRGVKIDEQIFLCDNSWGTSFGVNGSFEFSWDTMTQLLAEQGDCTQCLPLTAPAPVPVPVPVDADHALWYGGTGETEPGGAQAWQRHHHTGSNHELQTDLRTWAKAKGLPL